VLADVYNAFSIALRKTLVHIAHDSVADVDTTDLHHALVDAIAHGDEEGASAMAARLIETDAERLRSALTL
jgi:DNA-binding FadR family transcriptional regulator